MKLLSSLTRNLKPKQIASLAAIALGVILVIVTKGWMHEAEEAKSTTDHVTNFFTNKGGIWDPVIKFFGGQVHAEASKYDTTLSVLLIIGIALIVLGVIGFFRSRKK